jgi:hypothetical protein
MKPCCWGMLMIALWAAGCTSEQAPAPKPAAGAGANLAPMAGPVAPVLPDQLMNTPPVQAQPAPQPVAQPTPVAPVPATPIPAVPAGVPQGDMERVKAQKGVGIAGRSLDPYEGVIVTPAKTLFTVRERVVFEAEIPKALQLYKATSGQGPKSHDEFMTQVIQANQIRLPELPPGQRYVYDPKTEELNVERPRR